MEQTSQLVNELNHAFTEFKAANDERLKTLETQRVDCVLEDKLVRLEQDIQLLSDKITQAEAAATRPELSDPSDGEHKENAALRTAFCDYLRRGEEKTLQTLEHKTLSVGSDPDGGYLVSPVIANKIQSTLEEHSTMRRLAQVITIGSDAIEMLVDQGRAGVGWVGEVQQRSETPTPLLNKRRIPVHEMYAKPKATQKLLDDANVNVEQWLAEKIASQMAALENAAFLRGTFSYQPRGILGYTQETPEGEPLKLFKTGQTGNFAAQNAADVLLDMLGDLKSQYLPNATWVMSRAALTAARKLKDKQGSYLWQPSLAGDLRSTLLGYPIEIFDELSDKAPTKQAKIMVFGDFRAGYLIVDRQGTRVLRDPYSAKPYVEFYTTRRVGGDVVNFDALKVLKFTQN